MHLVTPKDPPKHDRIECPNCGIITDVEWIVSVPERSMKTGKWKRNSGIWRLICSDCRDQGRGRVEVGR